MQFIKHTSVVLFLFVFIFSSRIFAQDPPIEWEEIPEEDLKMTSYSADTSASALILCDYAVTGFNDELSLVFERHYRVKIFNENGYDYATHEISLSTDDDYFEEVEGITYWLDEEGEILTAELDEEDVHKENTTDGLITYKFTMPGLKPGCIIDIRYKIITDNVQLVRDWYFQYEEPVRWSEYRLIHLSNFSYSAVTRGYEPFYINEISEISKVVFGRALSYSNNQVATCKVMRWVVKDAPAVREEPYSTCINDYKNKVEIQLSAWAVPGHGVERIYNDWKTFIKETLDGSWCGKKINTSGNVKDLALSLTADLTTAEEKIKAIHKWVSNSIVKEGNNTRYAQKGMNDVISSKKGNTAEINLLLLSLLRSIDIASDPLILSTRSNGKIQEFYPIYSQFNYLIVRAKAGTRYYYLDATDPLRPYDMLPSNIVNVKALVVKEGSVEWAVLKCDRKNTTLHLANILLDKNGNLSGSFESSFGEYSSISIRRDLQDKQEKDVITELMEAELYGFNIDSIRIINKDSIDSPLKVLTYVSSDHYIQKGGDLIYLNPNLVFRTKENPFKSTERKYPVDYGYKRVNTRIININIPPELEIREIIGTKSLKPEGANLSYSRKISADGSIIQMVCNITVNDLEVKPASYKHLRKYYSDIISAESEQIVLAVKP